MDRTAAYQIVDGVLQRLAHSRTEEEFASGGLGHPSEGPGQARRRKVPAKFKFGAKSTYAFPTLQVGKVQVLPR
ncbi:hypothetical protein N1851_026049 [Merluccius polli]|uniref:Uncharacterized protein n=1 Tax=Merluccius polli TaxID=89951 RepID=A0AA47MCI1_MERPO|nr:hypothetical protein N1851_026049 [Merluccius polli]